MHSCCPSRRQNEIGMDSSQHDLGPRLKCARCWELTRVEVEDLEQHAAGSLWGRSMRPQQIIEALRILLDERRNAAASEEDIAILGAALRCLDASGDAVTDWLTRSAPLMQRRYFRKIFCRWLSRILRGELGDRSDLVPYPRAMQHLTECFHIATGDQHPWSIAWKRQSDQFKYAQTEF